MTTLIPSKLKDEVVSRYKDCPDPRLKEIMISLVKHLHSFAREVKLTEAEWIKGVEFLTRVGQFCTETRQEFILLSDVLGLEMTVVELNHGTDAGETEATLLARFLHHVMVCAKAKMHFCGGGEVLAKSGLNNAAKPALRDTAGKPPLFFRCRCQHPQVLSQRSGAGRSKRAPGEESSS